MPSRDYSPLQHCPLTVLLAISAICAAASGPGRAESFDHYQLGSIIGQQANGNTWQKVTFGRYDGSTTQPEPQIIADPTGSGRGKVLSLNTLEVLSDWNVTGCLLPLGNDLIAAGNRAITVRYDEYRTTPELWYYIGADWDTPSASFNSWAMGVEGSEDGSVPEMWYTGPSWQPDRPYVPLASQTWHSVALILNIPGNSVTPIVDGVRYPSAPGDGTSLTRLRWPDIEISKYTNALNEQHTPIYIDNFQLLDEFGHDLLSVPSAGNEDIKPRPEHKRCNDPMYSPGGAGGSAGDPVNLATGQEMYTPGPDIAAYNSDGPDAVYQRTYYSGLARSLYASPGLSSGWVDNYDYRIYCPSDSVGPLTLVGPLGSTEILTPTNGGTLGTFDYVPGTPYTVDGLYQYGRWQKINLIYEDGMIKTFERPLSGGCLALGQITDKFGRTISINRDPSYGSRLTSITNGPNHTGSNLLAFAYAIQQAGVPGYLATVTDVPGGRTVTYNVQSVTGLGDVLTSVSQPNATAHRWEYGYRDLTTDSILGPRPHLTTISVPNPTGNQMSTATINYVETPEHPWFRRVLSLVDGNGNQSVFKYEGLRTLVAAYAPGVVPYDANTDPMQGPNLSRATDWWWQDYDGNKRQTGITDRHNVSTLTEYETDDGCGCGEVSAVTDRNGRTTHYEYYVGTKNLWKITDPHGVVATLSWDYPTGLPFGRLQTVAVSGQAISTTYVYDLNNPFLVTGVSGPAPAGSGISVVSTSLTYSPLGNLTQIVGPGNNATTNVTTTLNYTTDGAYTQTEKRGQPLTVSVGGTSQVTHYRYTTDGRGNPASFWAGNDGATDFHYNDADQVDTIIYPHTGDTGTGRRHTNLTYLYPGGPLVQTANYDENPLNSTPVRTARTLYGPEGEVRARVGDTEPVALAYDPLYRVKAVADAHGLTVNLDGSVTMSTDPNLLTTTTYDDANDIWSTRTPTGHVTRYAHTYQPRTEGGVTYQDSVITRTDALEPTPSVTNFTYAGSANELTDITYSDTTPAVHFTYDNYGRRWTMSDGQGMTTYGYDDQDNPTSVITQYGTLSPKTIAYAYWPDGSRKTMTVPYSTASTYTLGYTYNTAGRLSSVSENGTPYAYWYYDTAGRLTYQSLNNSSYSSSTYTYDTAGQLRRLYHYIGQEQGGYYPPYQTYTIFSNYKNMTYDAVGNRASMEVEFGTGAAFPSYYTGFYNGTNNYSYSSPSDRYGQLYHDWGTRDYGHDFSYVYDPAGNITQFGGQTGLTYDNDNQRTNGGFVYDSNGNPTTYEGAPFTFDAENRLTQVKNAQNSVLLTAGYNGDSLRAWKQGSTSSTKRYILYDGQLPLAEMNPAGAVYLPNVFGPNGLVREGTSGYTTFDPSGNASITDMGSDSSGSHYYGYYAYEGYTPAGGYTSSTKYNYAGQYGAYTDSETGLVLMGYRYYDPGTGRFVTKDPIGFAGGVNLYVYTTNNPVNFVDPMGLDVGWGSIPGNDPYGGYLIPPAPPHARVDLNIVRVLRMKQTCQTDTERYGTVNWWLDKVRNNGKVNPHMPQKDSWDYKQLGKRFGDFGNFNYGATGRAMGLTRAALLKGAGVAQIRAGTWHLSFGLPGIASNGDDPNDQWWITAGMNYYDSKFAR